MVYSSVSGFRDHSGAEEEVFFVSVLGRLSGARGDGHPVHRRGHALPVQHAQGTHLCSVCVCVCERDRVCVCMRESVCV